jgi:hypothetical protein
LEARASKEQPVQIGGVQVTVVAGVLGGAGQLLVRQARGDVGDRTPGADGGDVELGADVLGFQGRGAVGGDVRTADMRGGGDLGDIGPAAEPPQRGGGVVAEDRALAARQHGSHRPRDRLDPEIADRVHAGVDAHQLPGAYAIFDRLDAEAEPQELRAGDVTVLPGGHEGDKC